MTHSGSPGRWANRYRPAASRAGSSGPLDHHFLVRLEQPVPGLLSFYSHGSEAGSGVSCVGYLFADDAPDYVQREQAAWQEWLVGVAAGVAADAPTA